VNGAGALSLRPTRVSANIGKIPGMLELAALTLFPLLMAYAATSDILTMKISNRISMALIALFFVFAIAVGMPLNQMGLHLASGATILVITFVLFSLGWIGGGDAKLAASTALWFGWPMTLEYCALASIFGGMLGVFLVIARARALHPRLMNVSWIARLHDRKTGVPYGVALAAAGLMLYPHSDMWRAIFSPA